MKISGWRMPISGCRTERRWILLNYFYFSLSRVISILRILRLRIFVLGSPRFFFLFQQISQQTLRRDLERPNRRSRDQRGGRFSIIEHGSRHRILSKTRTQMPDYL